MEAEDVAGTQEGRRTIRQWLAEATRLQGSQFRIRARVCDILSSCSQPGADGPVCRVFQSPWDKILQSTDAIAASHQLFAQRIEKDVEASLRSFHAKKEMQNMQTISANLIAMAKELDDAVEKSEKLTRKGGKANSHKVDLAASRLDAATSQWESQAPFIFETLQAIDEQRINHLRDVLTQFETHEVDQATRTQATAEDVLNTMLEVSTEQEIQNFVHKTTAGKPKVERKTMTRQSSVVASSNLAPPSTSGHDDDVVSDHSVHREGHPGRSGNLGEQGSS